ncbi:NifB/NifX family molybdenum-iron cluster-binding protein [Thermococcus waiotapuensis]|uniref:NifB/NifX family molybdenum-iron cluster-binding protein n=1 Tax=Thermococcus waiotapuensis TaxID=90909 RepID=A0AAE4NTC3_9EURY|nr:NifB/NifX family molybdenum-iron cluster-binding protein [Thermococcus waiotapuensis]MDV3103499.1 NifB/NifX family molybdenum-iron cluster-binding protein [Thermococcus waiotapuensis]
MVKTLVAVPTFKGGLDDEVHESLVRAETFTLVEVEGGAVRDVKVIENPYRREPSGAGPKVVLFLVNLGVRAIISRTDCPKGRIILDSAGVKMVILDTPMKVRDALRGLR